MASKNYMSKKEYDDFIKSIQESNKKYSDKIKIDLNTGVPLSQSGIKLQTMHLYKKDTTQTTPKSLIKIATESNDVVGTFERYLKVDPRTARRIDYLNARLRDLQVPDKQYNFTAFVPGVNKANEYSVVQQRNESPLNRTQFLYRRLETMAAASKKKEKLQVSNKGLAYDLQTQRPQTLDDLIRLASPVRDIQSLQNIITIENQNYLDKIKKIDPNMLTDDIVKSREAQLGEALDKYGTAKDNSLRYRINENARRDRDDYIKFLYYAFGVTVSSNDKRKTKLTMTDLRNGHNETITKYASNKNLQRLIQTLNHLSGPRYLAAISQQSGIGRWELMDTVKKTLAQSKVQKDDNFNNSDQQYDLEVVDGQEVSDEKAKILDNIFYEMNEYFLRYAK